MHVAMIWFVGVLFMSLGTIGQPYGFTYDGHEYVSDMENDWGIGGRMNKPKCIDIPNNLHLCRGIGYPKMRLPNLLGHDTIDEVIQQSHSWIALARVQCHPETQLFLCSLFSPVCLERTTSIQPCRSLCERVRRGCERKMNYWGYLWPDMVKCDQFPVDSELCIQPQHNTTNDVCEACGQTTTREGMLDSSCRSEFIARVKIQRIKTNKRQKKIMVLKKKKKFIKTGPLTRRERREQLNVIIEDEGNPDCECDMGNITTSKYLIMGNKTADGEIKLTYISLWMRDRSFRRKIRDVKNFDCSKVVDMIEQPSRNNSTSAPTTPNRGNAGGNRGNGGGRRKGGRRKNRRKNRNRKRNRNNKNKRRRGRKGNRGNKRRNGSKSRRRQNSSSVTVPSTG